MQDKKGKRNKTQEALLNSVYNESVAIVTRQGAPAACHSIDRRCLNSSVRDLINDDVGPHMFLLCKTLSRYGTKENKYLPEIIKMKMRHFGFVV